MDRDAGTDAWFPGGGGGSLTGVEPCSRGGWWGGGVFGCAGDGVSCWSLRGGDSVGAGAAEAVYGGEGGRGWAIFVPIRGFEERRGGER
jgi:hypothetical protein